jgi:hypothetical protein
VLEHEDQKKEEDATPFVESYAEDWFYCSSCYPQITPEYYNLVKHERSESKKEKEELDAIKRTPPRMNKCKSRIQNKRVRKRSNEDKRKREPDFGDILAKKRVTAVEWNSAAPLSLKLKLSSTEVTPTEAQPPPREEPAQSVQLPSTQVRTFDATGFPYSLSPCRLPQTPIQFL